MNLPGVSPLIAKIRVENPLKIKFFKSGQLCMIAESIREPYSPTTFWSAKISRPWSKNWSNSYAFWKYILLLGNYVVMSSHLCGYTSNTKSY